MGCWDRQGDIEHGEFNCYLFPMYLSFLCTVLECLVYFGIDTLLPQYSQAFHRVNIRTTVSAATLQNWTRDDVVYDVLESLVDCRSCNFDLLWRIIYLSVDIILFRKLKLYVNLLFAQFCGKVINSIDIGGESSNLIAAGGSDPILRVWDPRKPGISLYNRIRQAYGCNTESYYTCNAYW